MSRAFSFRDELAASLGPAADAAIRRALLDEIPGIEALRRSSKSEDLQGIDWWVRIRDGREIAIDAKVRKTDYGMVDVALEVWSVREKSLLGWSLDPHGKRTDRVLWVWLDSGRHWLVDYRALCAVFAENLTAWVKRYRCVPQTTDGSHTSECVFVPQVVIQAAMDDRSIPHEDARALSANGDCALCDAREPHRHSSAEFAATR